MDATAIATKWRAKLESSRARFDANQPVQVPLAPDEVLSVLAGDCPPEFEELRDTLKRGKPTHTLVRFPQLEALVTNAERQAGNHPTTSIRGRIRPKVDDQADVRAD